MFAGGTFAVDRRRSCHLRLSGCPPCSDMGVRHGTSRRWNNAWRTLLQAIRATAYIYKRVARAFVQAIALLFKNALAYDLKLLH